MFGNNTIYGNMGFPQGTGYQYTGMPVAPQKINNVLTNEEIQKLIQKENQFSLQLTETEVLRAKCNHRTADGMKDAITEDFDGVSRCSICGYAFRPLSVQTSVETIQEAVDNIVDVLHTIKLIYIGMPADAAAEFFQIIPLIEKIPKLFEYAVKDYTKHERLDPYAYNNRNMSTLNLFNMLCGGMGMGMAPQQPGFDPNAAQAQAAPGFVPQMQPGFAQPYGMPYGMPTNGFGYNAPGYVPQTNGFAYQPQPQAPTTDAAAPAAPQTNVTETFKA